jgi:hypothetical protein
LKRPKEGVDRKAKIHLFPSLGQFSCTCNVHFTSDAREIHLRGVDFPKKIIHGMIF